MMVPRWTKYLLIFLILVSAAARADDILWQETKIPMTEAGSKGLETLLVWPNTPGKHPLALISHGSPRDEKLRSQITAIAYLPTALEFARRGFAVAVVIRRGYGSSGGGWSEGYGSCGQANYLHAALQSSADLQAAITYLDTLPQFDTHKILAVGVSAGGFATVALTALTPPKGLVAAINFAGGRGSTAPDSVCQADALTATFGLLGKGSHTPMLWVYAKNDHFFSPKLAQQFLTAFNTNGGNATLLIVPEFSTDGHTLFSNAGISTWTPILDDFLKQQNLVLVKDLLPLPTKPALKVPPQLSVDDQKAFMTYLAAPPHKAFAVHSSGAYGWRSGQRTKIGAEDEALDLCEQHTEADCQIYAVDDGYYKESEDVETNDKDATVKKSTEATKTDEKAAEEKAADKKPVDSLLPHDESLELKAPNEKASDEDADDSKLSNEKAGDDKEEDEGKASETKADEMVNEKPSDATAPKAEDSKANDDKDPEVYEYDDSGIESDSDTEGQDQ